MAGGWLLVRNANEMAAFDLRAETRTRSREAAFDLSTSLNA